MRLKPSSPAAASLKSVDVRESVLEALTPLRAFLVTVGRLRKVLALLCNGRLRQRGLVFVAPVPPGTAGWKRSVEVP